VVVWHVGPAVKSKVWTINYGLSLWPCDMLWPVDKIVQCCMYCVVLSCQVMNIVIVQYSAF